MKRITLFFFALCVAVPAATAEGILDWLKPAVIEGVSPGTKGSDAAELLTLEPGETEMYPKPSPDGRFLLVVSRKGRHVWVSRRFAENGDPANRVTEDPHALDSIAWRDNGHVYFLSGRAGGLGLWQKIADGEGMLRRILALHGRLTQPLLLADNTVIAVELTPAAGRATVRKRRSDAFVNWRFPGYHTSIVHILKDGSVHRLTEGVNPALSPDGKWVVFSMPVGRSVHLFRMHPDGSDLIQITDARSVDVQPTWSPDGRWIVFTSNRAHPDLRQGRRSNWDIWAIQPDGRNLIRITRDPARDGAPAVDRSGRIYFHSDRAISRRLREEHQVKSVPRGFHIWTIPMPVSP